MNSFETDMCRAVISWKFLIAVALQVAVLFDNGFGGTLYLMCIPLICTLPYKRKRQSSMLRRISRINGYQTSWQ